MKYGAKRQGKKKKNQNQQGKESRRTGVIVQAAGGSLFV